jgi:hypothetical protein
MPTKLGKSDSNLEEEWRIMNRAKANPGTIHSPYLAGMSHVPFPTGILHNGFSLDGTPAGSFDTDYTVFFWCPALSRFTYSGNRLSGLSILRSFNTTTSARSDVMVDSLFAVDSDDLYGTDFTGVGKEGVFWAGKIDIGFICPEANLSGAVFKGKITVQQWQAPLTVSQLIAISQEEISGPRGFSLQSSIVNNDLIFQDNAISPQLDTHPEVQGEIVHYAVVQTPNRSIMDGLAKRFTIAGDVKTNWVLIPDPEDTLSQSLNNSMLTSKTNLNAAEKTVSHAVSKVGSEIEKQAESSLVRATTRNSHANLRRSVRDIISNALQSINPASLILHSLAKNRLNNEILRMESKIDPFSHMSGKALTLEPEPCRDRLGRSVYSLFSRLSTLGVLPNIHAFSEFVKVPYSDLYTMRVSDIKNVELKEHLSQYGLETLLRKLPLEDKIVQQLFLILQVEYWKPCYDKKVEAKQRDYERVLSTRIASFLPLDSGIYVSPSATVYDYRGQPQDPIAPILARYMYNMGLDDAFVDKFFKDKDANLSEHFDNSAGDISNVYEVPDDSMTFIEIPMDEFRQRYLGRRDTLQRSGFVYCGIHKAKIPKPQLLGGGCGHRFECLCKLDSKGLDKPARHYKGLFRFPRNVLSNYRFFGNPQHQSDLDDLKDMIDDYLSRNAIGTYQPEAWDFLSYSALQKSGIEIENIYKRARDHFEEVTSVARKHIAQLREVFSTDPSNKAIAQAISMKKAEIRSYKVFIKGLLCWAKPHLLEIQRASSTIPVSFDPHKAYRLMMDEIEEWEQSDY